MTAELSGKPRATLIYDGDCRFCRLWVERWRRTTGEDLEYVSLQERGERFAHVSDAELERAIHLVLPDGRTYRAAEAVARALATTPFGRLRFWAYRRVPGVAQVSEAVYDFVARRRALFSKLTSLLWGGDVRPAQYFLGRALFLRSLGLIYVCAFVSIWVQIIGLFGANGILPVATFLERVQAQLGNSAWLRLPTLFWLDASDAALHAICAAGCTLGVLIAFGLAPRICLALAWAAYLSIVSAGQTFMSFQWDVLLLEAGFLAIFLAPGRLLPRLARERPPSRAALCLLHWLLFRLMFASGLVKLTWPPAMEGETTAWRDLSALSYHYQTQPLPNPLAWYMHRLPAGVHAFSVVVMYAIEIGLPFLIFMPRRPRHFACAAMILLQILILLTGNYGFFNLLAIALCLLLVDDLAWKRLLPGFVTSRLPEDVNPRRATWPALLRRLVLVPCGLILFFVAGDRMLRGLTRGGRGPILASIEERIEPFRSVNSYGLFRQMTLARPEIVIEGSADGETWLPYELYWKPGSDLKRRPAQIAPHMPRLDWQLWFAPMQPVRTNYWFQALFARLLGGSPTVAELFAENPFPDAPPRHLRATLFTYEFTSWSEREESGNWWKRSELQPYCTPVPPLR